MRHIDIWFDLSSRRTIAAFDDRNHTNPTLASLNRLHVAITRCVMRGQGFMRPFLAQGVVGWTWAERR